MPPVACLVDAQVDVDPIFFNLFKLTSPPPLLRSRGGEGVNLLFTT